MASPNLTLGTCRVFELINTGMTVMLKDKLHMKSSYLLIMSLVLPCVGYLGWVTWEDEKTASRMRRRISLQLECRLGKLNIRWMMIQHQTLAQLPLG
jgi:hypothetical protein